MNNHTWVGRVLPLNSFGYASLILIYGWFLLANVAGICIIDGIIYEGIERISVDGPAYLAAIIALITQT